MDDLRTCAWTGPASAHDSFILRQSNLWTTMENDGGRGIVLGDAAYPCRFWLMTPIASPTTPAETHYNNAHGKTRRVVERAFGRLKKRFNVLHQENRRKLEHVVSDIAACFVLHNFAIAQAESDELAAVVIPERRRNRVAFAVPPVPPPAGHSNNFGFQRRRRIVNQLYDNRGL